MMFSIPEFQQLQQWITRSTEEHVRSALGRERPEIHDLAALLSPAAE